MIIINGAPKSGTHCFASFLDRIGAKRCPGTVLACTRDQTPHVHGAAPISIETMRLLPDNLYMIGHVAACHADALAGCAVVVVQRDPRNCLTSYCRHRARVDGVRLTIAEAIADYWGAPFVETYRGYLGWRGKAAVVRYEDLPPAVVGDGSGVYCHHDAHHNTRTDRASNYVDDWTTAAWAAWRLAGGPELLAEAGYI